jgi:hypothetical protein
MHKEQRNKKKKGSLPPRQRSTVGLQLAATTSSPTDLTFNVLSKNVAG